MDVKKLKLKVEEMLNKDDKTDPIVVERVNQIFNDAIAGMPPEKLQEPVKEKPEELLVRRLKEQIEAVKVKSDASSETSKKLKEILALVESAPAAGATGATGAPIPPAAAPIPSVPPAAPKPA